MFLDSLFHLTALDYGTSKRRVGGLLPSYLPLTKVVVQLRHFFPKNWLGGGWGGRWRVWRTLFGF